MKSRNLAPMNPSSGTAHRVVINNTAKPGTAKKYHRLHRSARECHYCDEHERVDGKLDQVLNHVSQHVGEEGVVDRDDLP